MSYSINMAELKSKVEETIRVAANNFSHEQEGETHLVGLHDGKDIREMHILNHYSKNVTYDGDTFIVLYRHEWFNPIEGWDKERALKHELDNDPEFEQLHTLSIFAHHDAQKEFVSDNFINLRNMLPGEAERLLKKWTEEALNDLIQGEVERSINEILKSGLISPPQYVYHVNDSVIVAPNKKEALKFYFEDTIWHCYDDEEEVIINIRRMSDEELIKNGAPCCLSGGCSNCAEGNDTLYRSFREWMDILGEGKRIYLLTREFVDCR